MNLKEMREEWSVTQEQLAKECGVVRQTISNIECGLAKPSVELAKKIGSTLNFDWALLFTEESGDQVEAVQN